MILYCLVLLWGDKRDSRVYFPWKAIWNVKASSNVSFFIWTEALGIILTVIYLLKQKIVLVQCCMCKHNGENVAHLLIYCPLDMELWYFVFVVFGVRWVMPRMVYGFASTLGRKSTLFRDKIWNACHGVFYRMSGRKRKRITFEEWELSVERFKYAFISSLFSWCH